MRAKTKGSELKIQFLISLLMMIWFALSACSKQDTGTKQTVRSQTGSNKAFPSNKHERVKNKRFRSEKSIVRNKQREHAKYQGNDEGRQ